MNPEAVAEAEREGSASPPRTSQPVMPWISARICSGSSGVGVTSSSQTGARTSSYIPTSSGAFRSDAAFRTNSGHIHGSLDKTLREDAEAP